MDEKFKEIIDKINNIPTLPVLIVKIIETINNPKSSAKDVNKVVMTDISLSSKILKLVNSSYYGLSESVNSITQAIVILGFTTIKNLALSASILNLFSQTENPNFRREEFWSHCLAVGLVAKLIAQHTGVPNNKSEDFFLPGLFHDIGKIVLDQYFHEYFDTILKLSKSKKMNFSLAEQHIIGTTHSDIGKRIAEKWNFPESIVEAIHFHHSPELSTQYPKITAYVYLADYLCKAKHIGFSGDYDISNFKEKSIKKFNVTSDIIKKLLKDEIDNELKNAKILFSVMISG
jgi:putative nucleotidyltransferase with HDIG domain